MVSDESLEAPQADAAEQQATADPADAATDDEERVDVPLESDEADAADQARRVPADEDEDYR